MAPLDLCVDFLGASLGRHLEVLEVLVRKQAEALGCQDLAHRREGFEAWVLYRSVQDHLVVPSGVVLDHVLDEGPEPFAEAFPFSLGDLLGCLFGRLFDNQAKNRCVLEDLRPARLVFSRARSPAPALA